MISDSRVQPDSRLVECKHVEPINPAACSKLLLMSVALSLLISLFLCTQHAISAMPSRALIPRLELIGPAADDPALQAWLASDRQWLAALPPTLLTIPFEGIQTLAEQGKRDEAGHRDTADSFHHLMDWLQQAERLRPVAAATPPDSAAAAVEPVRGRRDLVSELRDRWLIRGYLAARIECHAVNGHTSGKLELRVLIEPGQRYILDELTVAGDTFPGRQELIDAWMPRPGDVFLPEAYLAAAAAVILECAERGHPFPIWLTRSIRTDSQTGKVTVAAVLMPGHRMVIGPQTTNLPAGRGESFLIKAAGLHRGQQYRESSLRRGRERLIARDLYAHVDEPVVHVTAAQDTVGIIWQVEPQRRANRLSVVLGLSRREEGSSPLSGQVDLDLPNLAGTGRRLTAGWRDDGRTRSRFGFRYLEPMILGTPLDTDLALESEVTREAYTLFQVQNRWRLPVAGFWGLELGIGWDRMTYPEGELMGARRVRWRAGVLRQRGDRSRTGWSGSFAVETARRSTHLRSSPDADQTAIPRPSMQLGRLDRQRLLDIDVDGELWLHSEFSLAGRTSFRHNDAEEWPVPLPELYRVGGAASLRGYREDAFAGEKVAWGGLEARFGRARRSRVYTFVDVGYVERTVRVATDAGGGFYTGSDIYVGYGLGLLTMAAAGQINLAVGFPGSVDIEAAMLHVSLLGGF